MRVYLAMKCVGASGERIPHSELELKGIQRDRPGERGQRDERLRREIERATAAIKRNLREFPTCPNDGRLVIQFDLGVGFARWACTCCPSTLSNGYRLRHLEPGDET